MTSAPGSWSPGLQGLNARGALKVDLRCADGVEAGQKARSAAQPTCAVCRGAIQLRAALISASVAPLLRAHASATGALYAAT
jgi:hypothetical protein